MDEDKRLEFTSYLLSEGYDDAFWHSKFWDISEDEAESLLEEAQSVSVSDEISDYIQSQRDDLGAPDLVNKWDSPRRHIRADYNKKLWLIPIGMIALPIGFIVAPEATAGLAVLGGFVIFINWVTNLDSSDSETGSENKED